MKRFRVYRPIDNELHVIIDLDFEMLEQAEAAQIALHKIFENIEGNLIFGAKTTIINIVEETEL